MLELTNINNENKDRYISAKELSKRTSVPYQFMRGLLQQLAKASYTDTKEGLNGGVRLLKSPEQINIKDIIEIFQGKFQLIDCVLKDQVCGSIKNCNFKNKISAVEVKIQKELENIAISDLI